MTGKVNYLSNRELLKEIHRSKTSYCEFIDPEYHQYDIIVNDVAEIFDPDVQQQAQADRNHRIATDNFYQASAQYADGDLEEKPRLAQHKEAMAQVEHDELVYRVYTYEHIPLAPGRKRRPKKTADCHVKLNFTPFKHYVIRDQDALEVGRSHSLNHSFSNTHGSITDKLARMCMLLVDRYSQRANWRRYSYLDEMMGQSLLQLSDMALQFDEAQSNNPFSYYTRVLQNSFTRVLNTEKKMQRAKDEILISRGQTPSFGRQLEHEAEQRANREDNDS
ncbi:MAG: hypothetical protein ACRC16_15475 [Aeromonas salmonicida]